MDRYELARQDVITPEFKKVRFKFSSNATVVYAYMKKCIQENKILEASNLNDALLDRAIIKISKEYETPIVVDSEKMARILSVSQAYAKIYTLETLPDKYSTVICYWDLDRSKLPDKLVPIFIIEKNLR